MLVMFFVLVFNGADLALGRFSVESLSHQSRMELLVEDMAMKGRFCDSNGEFKDISNWTGTTLDVEGNVTHIRWWHGSLSWRGGSIDLQYLPDTVEFAQLNSIKVEGTFSNCHLPRALKFLNISNNLFHGSVLLNELLDGLERINLQGNQFSGSIDLTRLPGTLEKLILCVNKFCGEIDLSKLPPAMHTLALNENELTGSLFLNALPDSLRCLNLQVNKFSGDVTIASLPDGISRINIGSNNLAKVKVDCLLPNNMHLLLNDNEGISVIYGNVRGNEGSATWHVEV